MQLAASPLLWCGGRWLSPSNPDRPDKLDPAKPDEEGAQLVKIRKYLQKHPEVKYVWYDYWSVPQVPERNALSILGLEQLKQGDGRSPFERAQFVWMLRNANMLYLGCSVLILLDLTYLGRFW